MEFEVVEGGVGDGWLEVTLLVAFAFLRVMIVYTIFARVLH